MKEKSEFVRPTKKGICINCKSKMINFHGVYYCFKCGDKIKYGKRKPKR